ncbi:hypothetical protein I551_7110 [Mycobacterium ulcerans str. Harvey]|uniref:Uncharacterized protein n=1 Tax=Mycobacterium ulcerans str. Harvey TaxID=1299332 RepID=A0ABN0QP22_MYCUL|nr:hypothetical protein I551_7110 [Mycobacterium ulcerans str. Harvey]
MYDVCAVTGGTQNVMLRFTRSGRTYVLRRGPATCVRAATA